MRFVTPRRRTVDGFVYWLQTHPRPRPYSPRSITAYTDQAHLFQRWLDENHLDPTKVTKEDLLDHLSDMAGAGYAQSSISLRLITLRLLYDFFMERGAIKANPARLIPIMRPIVRSGEPYTSGELAKMYHACRDHQERAVFMLLLGTGLRRSEVFRVSKPDCNFEAGTIRVLAKGGQYRYVKPEPAVMRAVESALEFNDRLCPQKRVEYVYRLIKRLAERAGIPGRHHPHRLRFTFAVSWCEAGGQESELMMALGHSNMRQTLYYSKVGRERRALSAMHALGIASRLLGPVAGS